MPQNFSNQNLQDYSFKGHLLDLGKPVNNRNEVREYINYSLGETLAFAVGEIAVFCGAIIGCVWRTKIDTRNKNSCSTKLTYSIPKLKVY